MDLAPRFFLAPPYRYYCFSRVESTVHVYYNIRVVPSKYYRRRRRRSFVLYYYCCGRDGEAHEKTE